MAGDHNKRQIERILKHMSLKIEATHARHPQISNNAMVVVADELYGSLWREGILSELRFYGQQSHQPCSDAASQRRMRFCFINGGFCTVIIEPNDAPILAGKAVTSMHLRLEEFSKFIRKRIRLEYGSHFRVYRF